MTGTPAEVILLGVVASGRTSTPVDLSELEERRRGRPVSDETARREQTRRQEEEMEAKKESHLVDSLLLPGSHFARRVVEGDQGSDEDLRRGSDLGENELRIDLRCSN